MSGLLTRRRVRPGLPRRRRIAGFYLALLVLVAACGALVGARSGGPAGALGAAIVFTLLGALNVALWPIYFRMGRANLRVASHAADALDAIPVRTTADFSAYPPGELSVLLAYLRPWISYQLMTVDERALTLHTAGRRGWSGGAKLRFDRVESIAVGTANFGTLVERAILVTGSANGRQYEIGIVPVSAASRQLTPVNDSAYRKLFERLIAYARAAESAAWAEDPEADVLEPSESPHGQSAGRVESSSCGSRAPRDGSEGP